MNPHAPAAPNLRDIPGLVDHFVEVFSRRMDKQIDQIPDETMAAFEAYGWPGNIRELQNLVERALILRTLEATGWVLGGTNGASARLGLKRTTLIYKMRRLGIERPGQAEGEPESLPPHSGLIQ